LYYLCIFFAIDKMGLDKVLFLEFGCACLVLWDGICVILAHAGAFVFGNMCQKITRSVKMLATTGGCDIISDG